MYGSRRLVHIEPIENVTGFTSEDLCLEISLICNKPLNVAVGAPPIMFRNKELEQSARNQTNDLCRRLTRNENIHNPNERLGTGDAPLHAIVRFFAHDDNQLLCIERLLKQKADPNALDYNRMTPLMLAAQSDQPKVVRLLANHETTLLDVQDGKGNTALNHAVSVCSVGCVQQLLYACKARQRYRMLLLKNSDSLTADQLAKSLGHTALATTIASELAKFGVAEAKASAPPVAPKPVPQGGWVSYRKQFKKAHSLSAPTEQPKERKSVEDTVRRVQQVHHARGRFLGLLGAFHEDKDRKNTRPKLTSSKSTTNSP